MNERSTVWETIHRGSYPELQDGKVVWSEYYSDYVKTYLERDVRAIASTVPDAPRVAGADIATRLKQLDALKSQGLITEAEYAAQRMKIISEI